LPKTTRLLTLTGSGGAGKTRLALASPTRSWAPIPMVCGSFRWMHLPIRRLCRVSCDRARATSRQPLGIAGETTWRVPVAGACQPESSTPFAALRRRTQVRGALVAREVAFRKADWPASGVGLLVVAAGVADGNTGARAWTRHGVQTGEERADRRCCLLH
jgi:hypothetical protein